MGTLGDIRTRFDAVMKYGIFETVEKKNMKDLVTYLKGLKTKPRENTEFKVAGKTISKPEIDKIINKAGIEYEDDVKTEKDPSKLKGLERSSYVMNSQLNDIEDPEQRKNAELVISTIDTINDPEVDMSKKVELLAKLNDEGLIKKNAGGTKVYLDQAETGLSRKILLPSNKNPRALQDVVDEYGKDNLEMEKSNRINKKAMTGANVFGDKKEMLSVGVTEKGVDFDGVKYEKTEIPSDEKLLSIYGSEEKAQTAKKYLEKQNKIIELAQESFSEESDMEILQAVPNTPPVNEENRTKLKDATSDLITSKLKEQIGDKKPSPGQKKFFEGMEELKDVKPGKEYDDKLMGLTEEMFKDPYLETGSADMVEMVSYMRELNKGNAAYLPAKSNYPLGDIISISPAKIDFDKDSPEEINKKMELIMTSVEARSIKKGAGGASSSGEKTELTTYKEIKDSKGNSVAPEEIKGDLSKLSDKEKLYSELFDGDSSSAKKEIENLAGKYGFDLQDEKYSARREKSVKSAVDNITKKNPDVDSAELQARLETYYDMGNVYETVYNDTVKEQLFTNEQWKYSKTKGLEVNRTDGINSVAKLKFAFSIGWSKNGRPANTVPTRFVNTKV